MITVFGSIKFVTSVERNAASAGPDSVRPTP